MESASLLGTFIFMFRERIQTLCCQINTYLGPKAQRLLLCHAHPVVTKPSPHYYSWNPSLLILIINDWGRVSSSAPDILEIASAVQLDYFPKNVSFIRRLLEMLPYYEGSFYSLRTLGPVGSIYI